MAEFTNIKINDVKYDVRDANAARASDLAAKQDTINDLDTIRSGAAAGATALQSYTETDPTVPAWAKASTKPSYTASEISGLATVATSGSYNDLADKPVIPAAITVDSTITQNGTNPVQGGAIYSALDNKANIHGSASEVFDASTLQVFCSNDEGVMMNSIYSDDEIRLRFIGSVDGGSLDYTFDGSGSAKTIATTADIASCVPTTRKINNKPLSNDITLTSSDVGAVPTTRTINGKALSSNITLSASDVGALPSSTHIPADQVQSNWNETNTSSKAYIQNKPTIPTVPTKVSSFTNDAGYLTQHQSLANYYTKSEIDSKIGNIETLLASI